MALLEVEDLRVRFETHQGTVRAVDGVDLRIERGEVLALVGESGSGKSVTSLAVMGLIPSPPGVVEARGLRFAELDLLRLDEARRRRVRGARISMIFQDPMTSLNPLLSVGRQLSEVLEVHRGLSPREARARCAAALGDVGIPSPEARLDAFPHELSGGMRQRVMIAMALLCDPELLIADEPTTALDVTIQAQILELMANLRRRKGTSILLITHDLGVVAGMADRVHVLYAGRLVETAPTTELFAAPAHPYTAGLLASVPTLVGDADRPLASIGGQPPDLSAVPPGCAFAPRCAHARQVCLDAAPPLESLRDPRTGASRAAACVDARELLAVGGSR